MKIAIAGGTNLVKRLTVDTAPSTFNTMSGVIDHRILLNYRIDPDVASRVLPAAFRPKLVNGCAIGGICQVSLSSMRPRGLPGALGVSSHNVAHRIAVEHNEGEGVYIPRRDTSSVLSALAGGRIFPGAYRRSNFEVESDRDQYRVDVQDSDGRPILKARAQVSDRLPESSVFGSVGEASDFFRGGNVGWSPSLNPALHDTIELWVDDWRIEALDVPWEHSGYFSDESRFPKGSVTFDSGLIMRGHYHEWRAGEPIDCAC